MMCNRNFNRLADKSVQGFLSWDTFGQVRPFFKYARRVEFSGFGEPLLHPQYISMLREIKKSGTFVYFFTNGLLLNEKIAKDLVEAGTDMVCVSMGGATRETYKKIRGIDGFDKVVHNLHALNEFKKKAGRKKPVLSFNIVIMNSLLPELPDIVRLADTVGVEHIAFPNLVVQGQAVLKESIWNNKQVAERAFRKARELAKALQIQIVVPKLETCLSACKDFFTKLFITWDGKVLSCPLERFIVGDLNTCSLSDIWNGRGTLKLRRDYHQKGLKILCPDCPSWNNCPDVYLNPWYNGRDFAQEVR
jgi:MoaA/NifB/PqqE/SkfB family radical SAM enzyme